MRIKYSFTKRSITVWLKYVDFLNDVKPKYFILFINKFYAKF